MNGGDHVKSNVESIEQHCASGGRVYGKLTSPGRMVVAGETKESSGSTQRMARLSLEPSDAWIHQSAWRALFILPCRPGGQTSEYLRFRLGPESKQESRS